MLVIDRSVDLLEKLGFCLFALAILNRFPQQVPERRAFERFLSEYVVDSAAESASGRFELLK